MLFSVIVPMYNVEKYIRQCIESVLNQSFQDFELILVDDGTKDASGRIADEYAKTDSRIRVIHKENGGIVSARKAGAEAATGEYAVVVDGDDWIGKEYLQTFYEAICVSSADVICCQFVNAYPDHNENSQRLYHREGLLEKSDLQQEIYPTLFAFLPNLWSKAIKMGLYKKYQLMLDNSIAMGDDGAVIYPLLLEVDNVYLTNQCLYFYRQNPLSITGNKKKEVSFEGLLSRIQHFESILPFQEYRLNEQFIGYVAHASFTIVRSYFQANSYSVACKKSRALLDWEPVEKYIKNRVTIGSKAEKLAGFALKNRWWLLVKLYVMLFR